MRKQKVLEIVYNFFPRGIDSMENNHLYIQSKEYKRLIEKIKLQDNYRDEIREFINGIRSSYFPDFDLNDISYFEWGDRCYTFELVRNIEEISYVIRLYFSILFPFFLIKSLKISKENNKYRYTFIDINTQIDRTELKELKEQLVDFGYVQFDDSILFEKIEDINFDDITMGRFTFSNAFFLNNLI